MSSSSLLRRRMAGLGPEAEWPVLPPAVQIAAVLLQTAAGHAYLQPRQSGDQSFSPKSVNFQPAPSFAKGVDERAAEGGIADSALVGVFDRILLGKTLALRVSKAPFQITGKSLSCRSSM